MELEQLKEKWNNTPTTEQQFDKKTIEKMINKKYRTGFKKIAYPELIGAVICWLGILFIVLKFDKLDNNFLQSTGLLTILLLAAVSIISLKALKLLNFEIGFVQSHTATLKYFLKNKNSFYKLQKINSILCYVLLVNTIILVFKFFGNTDIIKNNLFWTSSLGLGFIFLLSITKYVSNAYKNTILKNEELLKELAETDIQ
jgi:hypothetical protein